MTFFGRSNVVPKAPEWSKIVKVTVFDPLDFFGPSGPQKTISEKNQFIAPKVQFGEVIWSKNVYFFIQSTKDIIDLPHPLALSTHQSIWVASAPCWGWMETGRWQKRPGKSGGGQE